MRPSQRAAAKRIVIGANTAIFTLVDAILLRLLPVQAPHELVGLGRNPNRPTTSFNYPDYRYLRDNARSYAGLTAVSSARPTTFGLPSKESSSQLIGLSMVSGNYFEVLGVQPAVGRLFNSADNEREGAHPFAVLSYGFWKRAFAANTGIVGQDVLLNGSRFQVIGVSREGFNGTNIGVTPDVFAPIVMYRTFNPTAHRWNTRNSWWLTVIGRLKPGVNISQARAEMDVLWERILSADPNQRPAPAWDKDYKIGNTAHLIPGSQGYSSLRNQTSRPLTVLMITVGLVLLIACANVANLLLARGIARRREIAVRLAIGAGRGRLIRQLLTESLTLSMLGGIAGLAVAWAGVRILTGFLPRGAFAVDLNLSPDLRVLGFALGLCVLSGLIFGLAPALRASRPDLVPALKASGATEGGRTRKWSLQRTLVTIQVSLSLLLLAGAGLFVRTLANLRDLDPGMVRENLLVVDSNISQLGYQPQRERDFHLRLREEVQRLPGVRSVGLAAITPLTGSRWNSNLQIEGYQWRPDERPIVEMNAVSPRFFESAGIPIVLGRDFAETDNLGGSLPNRPDPPPPPGTQLPDLPGPPRVAIVNEAFAKKFFPGQPVLGKHLCQQEKWDPSRTYEIVGVVKDARYFDIRKAVEPMMYQPRYREPLGGGGSAMLVRTSGDPNKLVETIRRKIAAMDPAIAVTEVQTMEDYLNRNLVQERFVALLGGFFGVVALLLAAIGLYGVMANSVTRRTKEIGIRMAIGAEARRVLWMVMSDALIMVAAGAVVGIGAALILMRYAESMLFGVKAQDPVTLGTVAALLISVTALAGYLPARRATRVHPMTALRQE